MDAPICPVHNAPMTKSNRGAGYYCTKKTGQGPKDYCREKWEPAPEVVPTSGGGPSSGNAILADAALRFSASLWGPTDPAMHDEALAFAEKVYAAMKARL